MKEVNYITLPEDARVSKLKKLHELKEKEWIARNKKLFAIIGHDIKTPMNSIIGFLSLLKEGVHSWNRNKIEDTVNIALLSATKTDSLLDNLLQWAITEKSIDSAHMEYIDIGTLLSDEIENHNLLAMQKQIKIVKLNFSEEKAFGDKNMIKSILRNLLTNAIKYSHNYGIIEISTTRNNRFLEVSIKDYGVGMEKKMVNTVFSTHHYTSSLGTCDEQGTGLGLLLCKEFIDIHKGKIWIISKLGKGSEIKFTLPILPQ